MYSLSRLMLVATVVLFSMFMVLATMVGVEDFFPQNQRLVFAILIVSLIAAAARKKGRLLLTSGGTSAWATSEDLEKKRMLDAESGLILGRVPATESPLSQGVKALFSKILRPKEACRQFLHCLHPRKRKQGRLVRLPQAVHTSVYAPTGVGKGVSCIVPFLLSCEESCVIVDGKDGELARLTAAARRSMGHEVILLDPARIVTQRPDTLNILDSIDKHSPRAINEADAIGNALVVRTGDEKEPHWLDKAEHWLSALTALCVWWGRKDLGSRSLLRVAEMVSNPQMLHDAVLSMQEHPQIWNGSLARKGGILSYSTGEEFGSSMSTLGRFINFMNSPSVAESLQTSSFDLSRLRKKRMSIYLIQRAADSQTGSPLLRLWLNACIREVMKGGLNQKNKVHVLIDEAASVGKMDCISQVLNVGRGFSLFLQLYYQDIGQLKKCWDNPQGVLANTTQIFFGVNDKETAEYVSARLGNETILVEDTGESTSWGSSHTTSAGQSSGSSSTNRGGGRSTNLKEQSRELLKPAEVTQLDPRTAITLAPGLPPLWTYLIRYYEETDLFRHRGCLGRLFAAFRTLLISGALLAIAFGATALVTTEVNTRIKQQQPSSPSWPPAPGFIPGQPPIGNTRPQPPSPFRPR